MRTSVEFGPALRLGPRLLSAKGLLLQQRVILGAPAGRAQLFQGAEST